jgi:prepilin-type N-terminal cleavage/methylation domain-containing protein
VGKQSGFSLVELALVLVIVTLALGGVLVPLNAQIEYKQWRDTEQSLQLVHDALLGFAVRNGRLPCPASATSNGMESPVNGGVCTNPYDGYVPAVSLGLSPLDMQGYMLDAWGNRLRYAVAKSSGSAFTTSDGIKNAGLSTLQSELQVCAGIAGTTSSSCGSATALSSSGVNAPPAVIFSFGKYAAVRSADESAEQDSNAIFVNHPLTTSVASADAYDDVVIWLSPNVLYGQMVNAGVF